jgi:hypothetical protein
MAYTLDRYTVMTYTLDRCNYWMDVHGPGFVGTGVDSFSLRWRLQFADDGERPSRSEKAGMRITCAFWRLVSLCGR